MPTLSFEDDLNEVDDFGTAPAESHYRHAPANYGDGSNVDEGGIILGIERAAAGVTSSYIRNGIIYYVPAASPPLAQYAPTGNTPAISGTISGIIRYSDIDGAPYINDGIIYLPTPYCIYNSIHGENSRAGLIYGIRYDSTVDYPHIEHGTIHLPRTNIPRANYGTHTSSGSVDGIISGIISDIYVDAPYINDGLIHLPRPLSFDPAYFYTQGNKVALNLQALYDMLVGPYTQFPLPDFNW